MDVIWILSLWLLLSSGVLSNGMIANVSSRPAVVNVGAIFDLNSTIGKVAKIAIEEAVKDVNSNSSVLHGTKLVVKIRDCSCNVFVGMIEALQFMETDIVAIIGPQSSVVAHTILNVADELKTPFLSFSATDPTLASLQFPYFVRTTQSDKHQMTAIAEIVEYYGWKQVIVIFVDDDYGRNGLFALDDALADRLCRVSYKAGIPPGDVNRSVIMDILVKVALMESRVIVLHAYPASGFLVFSLAQYLGMMGEGYVWIATDWLSSVLDSSSPFRLQTMMDTMQGVLVLRQHTQDSESKREFSARWNKLTGGSLGLNSYALYAYDTVWMVAHAIDSFFNQGGVISFSNDSKLQAFIGGKLHLDAMVIFDGGPLLLKSIWQSDFVGLTGQVKFSPDRFIVSPAYDIINIVGTGLHQIGYWSNYSGLSIVPPETLYSRPPNRSSANQRLYDVIWPGKTVRKPLGWVFPSNGKQLRIGVPNRFSYKEFVSQVPNTHTFKGFCIDVFTAAVNFLPYAVPYKFIPFGDGHENPNYTEIVNLITTGFFDGVVGDIAIVPNREKVVDFTQPFAAAGLVVLVPVTELNSGAWAFLRPFSPALWGVTAAFFLFVGIVVWVLEHRINDDFRGPPMKQLTTVLWFSFSTLFFSHKEKPMSLLGRIVVLLWLFVVLIINSNYTAGLTSILTVQRLSSPIKGIESLKDGDDIIGYQVGSFAEQFLTNEIGIPKSRLKALGSPDEYAKALLQGPKKGGVTAVVDEHPYVEVFLSSHCKFRIVGQASTRSGWGFAFPQDSQLAVDLSTAILTLSENGELQRIHDKWFTKSLCTTDDTEIESNRLHLSIFRGLFLMCGIVCVVAFMIYSWQIIHKYRKAVSVERASNGHGSAHSIRLQTLITLIDQKKDQSQRGRKRRKLLSDANQGE